MPRVHRLLGLLAAVLFADVVTGLLAGLPARRAFIGRPGSALRRRTGRFVTEADQDENDQKSLRRQRNVRCVCAVLGIFLPSLAGRKTSSAHHPVHP